MKNGAFLKEVYSLKLKQYGWKNPLPKVRSTNGTIAEADKKWIAKYTSPDTGSKKLSGWSVEGMHKFCELCQGIKQACASKTSKNLEAEAINLLKAKHGIQADTYEEWLKTKSSKKAKKNVLEPASIPFEEE